MINTKPQQKKQEQKKQGRPVPISLIVIAGVLLIIGAIMLLTNKVQSQDPTLTAAPPTGTSGQAVPHASASKMAYEQQIMAQQKAEMEAFKAANSK